MDKRAKLRFWAKIGRYVFGVLFILFCIRIVIPEKMLNERNATYQVQEPAPVPEGEMMYVKPPDGSSWKAGYYCSQGVLSVAINGYEQGRPMFICVNQRYSKPWGDPVQLISEKTVYDWTWKLNGSPQFVHDNIDEYWVYVTYKGKTSKYVQYEDLTDLCGCWINAPSETEKETAETQTASQDDTRLSPENRPGMYPNYPNPELRYFEYLFRYLTLLAIILAIMCYVSNRILGDKMQKKQEG